MSENHDSSALVDNMETGGTSPEKNSKSSKSAGKAKEAEVMDRNGDTEVQAIPSDLLRRVNALRKLQLDAVDIETELHRKVHELECEYAERMAPLREKRRQIVNGLYEPGENESDIAVPFEQRYLAEELEKQAAIKQDLPDSEKGLVGKGIDEFWLSILRNDGTIGGMVESHDEPILRHLTDVEIKVSKEPMKFTVLFHFSPNEYFSNTTLTKEYGMKCQPDPEKPFDFEGPEIVSSSGCKIDWKAGKNVTLKLVKKKQKHKQKGATRIVTKEEKAESFFNFFSPPLAQGGTEEDSETADLMEHDFHVGQLFRDTVVPHAVLYYTGETIDFDECEEDEDDDEEDYDDDSDDGESFDDDDDIIPRKK